MSVGVSPANVQVPGSATAPIVADFVEHAIRVAYVHRRDVLRLPEAEWVAPGIYVLLTDDGSHQVYVGQSVDLRSRLANHKLKQAQVPGWTRVIVIKRDTSHGFNSAEIGYLEGRVSAELGAISGLQVVKGKSDQDSTLPPHMLLALDAMLPSILAAVRLAGVDTYRGDDTAAEAQQKIKTHTVISGSVADLLAAGLVHAGATLFAARPGNTATGTIAADGRVIVDGVGYATPSAASTKALHLKASNGWAEWHLQSIAGPTLGSLREQLPPAVEDQS